MTDADRELPLFPLQQVVLFPGVSLPLRIFEERYKVMIAACQVTDQQFGVLLIRGGEEVGAPAIPERVGCTARMVHIERLPEGRMNILSVGERRFRLLGPARVTPEGYLIGDVRFLSDGGATAPPELVQAVRQEFENYQAAALSLRKVQSSAPATELPADPLALSYHVAASLHVHPRERQHLLELDDVAARLEQELKLLKRENRPPAAGIGPFSRN